MFILVSCSIEVARADVKDIFSKLDDAGQGEDIGEFVNEDRSWGRGGRVDEIEVGCCEEGYEELAIGADGEVLNPRWKRELMDELGGEGRVEGLWLCHRWIWMGVPWFKLGRDSYSVVFNDL